MPDNFNDELFLAIKSDDKMHILSSCSHNGISNITKTARAHFQVPIGTIVGGFHTKDINPEIIEHFTNYFNQIYFDVAVVCHCTCIDKYLQFKEKCKAKIYYNHTGKQIKI
jgi:7,8-dihydropterin-6-yl-methyl-4-(beta-D-ribofuranosyl)aminobenzene 5'-phosphate synthase